MLMMVKMLMVMMLFAVMLLMMEKLLMAVKVLMRGMMPVVLMPVQILMMVNVLQYVGQCADAFNLLSWRSGRAVCIETTVSPNHSLVRMALAQICQCQGAPAQPTWVTLPHAPDTLASGHPLTRVRVSHARLRLEVG